MLDAQALADRYVAAWNEPDAAKRSSAIAALWAPDALGHNGGRGYAPLSKLTLVTPAKNGRREGLRFRAAPTLNSTVSVATTGQKKSPFAAISSCDIVHCGTAAGQRGVSPGAS